MSLRIFLFSTLLLALLIIAPRADAQQWEATLTDDGVYRSAVVHYPGLGLSLRCHASSTGQGRVIDSIWFESTIPPPDQFLIEFSEQLVPLSGWARSDLIFFLDQTGYRLPQVELNELAGSIETRLSSADALFTNMPEASRMVLQVGATLAWELPVAGFAAAVDKARRYCLLTPKAVPSAPPAATGFTLPQQVQSHVDRQCEGPGRIAADALQAGDLDGDALPDIVLNWGGVLCPGEMRSGFCGAANCTVDLFLSSRDYALAHSVLAVGATLMAHPSGRLGLRMGGTASVCSAIDCNVLWLWNGNDLVQVP